MKAFSAMALLPLATMLLTGQEAPLSFQNPLILNEETGLPSNNILSIQQDKQGFVWIATARGLCRYDGSDIELLSHVPNDSSLLFTHEVEDMQVDARTGQLWLATALGLHVYNPFTDRFRTYVPADGDPASLPQLRVRSVYQDRQGEIWLGMQEKGLAHYISGCDGFENHLLSEQLIHHGQVKAEWANSVIDMTQDVKQDQVYWLASNAGLIRWNREKEKGQLFKLQGESYQEYLLNSPACLYQAANGKLYQGLWSVGFSIYDPETGQFRLIDSLDTGRERAALRTVYGIYPESEKAVWINSANNILLLFDTEREEVIRYWRGSVRSGPFFGLKIKDNQNGAAWGGLNRGVYIYHPTAQQIRRKELAIEAEEIYDYNPAAITKTRDGVLWACFESAPALYRLLPGEEELQMILPPKENKPTWQGWTDMAPLKDGRLLLSYYTGLFVIDKGGSQLKEFSHPPALSGKHLMDIFEDSRGDIWISTLRNGLFRRRAITKEWVHYLEALDPPGYGKHHTWLWGMAEDDLGQLWWRAASGYSVYSPERDTFLHFPYQDGQRNNFANINDLEPDGQGRIWVASPQQGLGYIDIRQPERGIIRKFGKADGFTLTSVLYLKRDEQGGLWILGDRLLARLRLADLAIEYFDQHYGLPAYDAQLGLAAMSGASLDRLSDGTMALGYRRGWALFRPEGLKLNEALPRPYVRSFKVFEKEYPLDSALWARQAPVELPYWKNFFSFEFSAIHFTASEQTRFKYQLAGFDEGWIEAGKRRYATYTNIPPGNYTFRLMAANSQGQWNEQAAKLRLRVATPWWRELWFVSLSGLFLLGLLYSGYRYRIGQVQTQKEREAEFERQLASVKMDALRAQMNPHFIFNSLNSIEHFINKNDSRKAAEYLNSFARLIRLILQNSRSELVPLEDELEAIRLYLEMEKLRFSGSFDFGIYIGDNVDVDAIRIAPMLIQPYIENAIWHGLMNRPEDTEGKVSLQLEQAGGELFCIIEDNGIGREKAMAINARKAKAGRRSLGMKITAGRMELINKLYNSHTSAIIHDLKDAAGNPLGTRVELALPARWEEEAR